ncbi:tetratricopeptide repeat protein [Roseibium salinum]|nr:tetratricopeptide repeat protein [Roseibium salinum]
MATQTAPNPVREKLLKGLSYQKSGEFEKAQRQYKQVLKKAPHNADALHLLGVTYRQLGFPKRAIEYIQKGDRHGSQPGALLRQPGPGNDGPGHRPRQPSGCLRQIAVSQSPGA